MTERKSIETRKSQRSSKKQQSDKTPLLDKNPYEDEIILMVTLVLSILLILSNFNLCGALGPVLSNFFFGMFGFFNYLLPIGLFIAVVFFLSNRGNIVALRKLIGSIVLFFIWIAVWELLSKDFDAERKMWDYYTTSATNKSGGGLLGGMISNLLCKAIGEIGTYVILFALIAVILMFITEKLLFASLGKKGKRTVHEIKNKKRQKQEELEQAYERDLLEPEKRKAKTFTFEKEDLIKKTTDSTKKKQKKQDKMLSKLEQEEDKEEFAIKIHRAEKQEAKKVSKETERFEKEITEEQEDTIPIYQEILKEKFSRKEQEEIEPDLPEIKGFIDALKEDKPILPAEQKVIQKEPEFNINMSDYHTFDETTDEKKWNKEESTKLEDTENVFSTEEETKQDKMEEQELNLFDVTKEEKNLFQEKNLLQENEDLHKSKKTAIINARNEALSNLRQIEKKPSLKIMPSLSTTVEKKEEAKVIPIPKEIKEYKYPPIDLLSKPKREEKGISDQELKATAMKLQSTLASFGVQVTITNVSCGPTVTRYELQPEQGVKVSKITGLADDIKLNLAAADIRIEAPIPGKAAVGIEVPNTEISTVYFRELMESEEFKTKKSKIAFAVGKDIAGQVVVNDIARMPHLLIAGATGSGKSVCINTLIMSILYKAKPDEVKLIMVDPKVVELSVYNGIPHLLIPVVTDPKKASAALNWAVAEMTDRYNRFAELGVRDLVGYNKKVSVVEDEKEERFQKMPQIVIIVDELADLMMVAPGEVEEAICRLAQLARAAGIHLIIATQRPSVNVITGVIKANVPSRIAFSVSSAIDSRTILDGGGAEKLLGKGDMLFFPSGIPKPVRVQGAFVSDQEVSNVVDFLINENSQPEYNNEISAKISSAIQNIDTANGTASSTVDDYFIDAGKFIIEKDKASIGMLQRVYKIGFNRAARIMDQLSDAGVVGPEEGTKPRKVLMSMEEFEQYIDEFI